MIQTIFNALRGFLFGVVGLLPDMDGLQQTTQETINNISIIEPVANMVGYFFPLVPLVQISIAFFSAMLAYNVYLFVMSFVRKVV